MNYIKAINDNISEYLDIKFFIRFILLYLLLYYFTPFYVALADPKGLLSSQFINHHYVNYVSFLENAIINTANFFAHLLSLPSYVIQAHRSFYESAPILKIDNGASIILTNGCLGLGVMSFWASFIISHDGQFKKKLLWTVFGVLVIFLINCFRITFLLYALQNKWQGIFEIIDHHTMFNLVSYCIIFLMIYSYSRARDGNNKRMDLTTADRSVTIKPI